MTTIVTAIGDESGTSEIEAALLDDVVLGSVDYKGRPSVRSKSGSWKSSPYIIGIGLAERFAYSGTGGNLVSYLTGQLGLSTAAAASSVNAWYGTTSLLPIPGAFVADSFTGRYWTIIISSVLYVLGLVFLSLSALLTSLQNSECQKASKNNVTCSPSQLQIIFFFSSLYLMGLAHGGHAPCVQAFGADQFDDEDKKERAAKHSFFNWWYCISLGGTMVPLFVLNYIQDSVSWVLAFGITALLMALPSIVFLLGTPTYRFIINIDGRNPIVRINRVLVRALRNWRVTPMAVSIDGNVVAVSPNEGNQFKFLDKALLAPNGSTHAETLCSIEDVEDAKSILRLIPIWCTTMGYAMVHSQPSTLFTKQAGTMERHFFNFEIPPASFQLFSLVSLIVFIPLYDRAFVPIARAVTKNPSGISMLQRIGVGMFLSLVSIVYAAIIEKKRLETSVEYGLVDRPNVTIPMSAIWLVAQYVLSGVADVFAMIGLQELFYEQVPSDLKSIGLALYLSIVGIGNLLSSLLVFLIQKMSTGNGQGGWFANNLNRAHIDYFYWLLSGLSAVGFGAYIYFAKSYVYRRRTST